MSPCRHDSLLAHSPAVRALRILYAEDHAELRQVTTSLFEREGHHVTATTDGSAAFNAYADTPTAFDLVVTDHWMPQLNGLELVTCLRAAEFPGKIVVLSSVDDCATLDAYEALRIDAFLAKPFSLAEIRRTLRRFAEELETEPASSASAAAPRSIATLWTATQRASRRSA